MTAKSTYRPMTEEEITVARLLENVKYPRFTSDMRLASSVKKCLKSNPPMVNKITAAALWRLLHRYQRQIRHPNRLHLVRKAQRMIIPHKQLEYDREYSRIRHQRKKELQRISQTPVSPKTSETVSHSVCGCSASPPLSLLET
jgi:uncharacterized protein YyaL (SSP411 family)